MTATSSRLDVSVVGAGRVGCALAAALAGAGHRIRAVSTSSAEHRERVEAMLPGVPVLDEAATIAAGDLVLLTIPADDVAAFVRGTAEAGVWHPGQIALHTSPGDGTDILSPLVARGVIPLAVHPAIDFSGTSLDVQRLRDAPMAVSAPATVLPIAQALVIEMGAEPIVIANEDRAHYAEALDVATGFSRAIIDQSSRLLRSIGIARPDSVLRAVVLSSVANALDRSARPDADEQLDDSHGEDH